MINKISINILIDDNYYFYSDGRNGSASSTRLEIQQKLRYSLNITTKSLIKNPEVIYLVFNNLIHLITILDYVSFVFLGCVDLNSCDCIYEQKVGNQLPNVFVVQTTYRGKRRDYLFSANTPKEMNEWITQLTKVLHMVPEQVSSPAPGG